MRRRRWVPEPTHWHRPTEIQAIQYDGTNAERVVAWAGARGLVARTTSWPDTPHSPPQEVRCDVHWVASGVHADGGLRPGDWLVMRLPDGEMQGWRDSDFDREYQPVEPG